MNARMKLSHSVIYGFFIHLFLVNAALRNHDYTEPIIPEFW